MLARGDGVALIRAQTESGRRHQVRAHLASVGLPILGDELYGALPPRRCRPPIWRAISCTRTASAFRAGSHRPAACQSAHHRECATAGAASEPGRSSISLVGEVPRHGFNHRSRGALALRTACVCVAPSAGRADGPPAAHTDGHNGVMPAVMPTGMGTAITMAVCRIASSEPPTG